MSKMVKALELTQLDKDFGDVGDVVIVNVIGLESHESHGLRMGLRKKGINLRVVKNNLAQRVLEKHGVKGSEKILLGPSAIAWGGDSVVELAKEIVDWAKKNKKIGIKGACVAGQTVDAAGVDSLSKMPNRLELLARISMLIQAPGGRLQALLKAPGGKLASQLKTRSEESAEKPEAAPTA